MAMEFDTAKASLSPSTQKALILFPQMLADQENMLREYHRDTAPVVFERLSMPLDNLKASTRVIATMYRRIDCEPAGLAKAGKRNFVGFIGLVLWPLEPPAADFILLQSPPPFGVQA